MLPEQTEGNAFERQQIQWSATKLDRAMDQLSHSWLLLQSIDGPMPSAIGTLNNFINLDLSGNNIDGVITHEHFANQVKVYWFVT